MKKIEIYDPAMCCSTGVCGASVDTELLRVATVVDNLNAQGADITRHGLASEPQIFVSNKIINTLLMEDNDILPVTIIDGDVVMIKRHLSNEEFEEYTDIMIENVEPENNNCCDNSAGCC